MASKDKKGICIGRRDFIKTSAMAVVGSTISLSNAQGNETEILSKPELGFRNRQRNKNLLCLSESTSMYKELLDSIKANPEIDFNVSMAQVKYHEPQKLTESIQDKNAGMLLIFLPPFRFSYGKLSQYMGDLDIPILLYSQNQNMIMINANFAAELRVKGANVKLATSEIEIIDLLKTVSSPGILEGKKALIYGRPFDSTSVPAHNLTEEYVYNHTGVGITYRPMDDLKTLLKDIDKASAIEDMKRWKEEAKEVDKIPDTVLLDECRLYILLRSIVEKEGLSAISMDCLSYTLLGNDPSLPLPCLAFARLRDEGITASCEADVCGMLSSMVFEKISGKPSYFANVTSVDAQKSSTVLRHCVAPLKFLGPDNPQLPYTLHKYHGMGKGVVPKVEFPIGIEVTMGAYTKDLKDFVLWPGKTCTGEDVFDESFLPFGMPKIRPNGGKMKVSDKNPPILPFIGMEPYCANRAEIEIKDANHFFHNIAGIHHIMIAGNYTKEIIDVMSAENVNIIGPYDSTVS